jgi:hypothetical protein
VGHGVGTDAVGVVEFWVGIYHSIFFHHAALKKESGGHIGLRNFSLFDS